MKTLFTVLMIFAAHSFAQGVGPSTTDLAWLEGKWVGEFYGKPMEEHFTAPKAGLILGMGRIADHSSVDFFEFMKFEDSAQGLIFRAWPFGEAGVIFTVNQWSQQKIVLLCPQNPFPRQITYELKAQKLWITIEGTENGEEVSMVIELEKNVR